MMGRLPASAAILALAAAFGLCSCTVQGQAGDAIDALGDGRPVAGNTDPASAGELRRQLAGTVLEAGEDARRPSDGAGTPTAMEVAVELRSRGFGGIPISVDFAMDGTYLGLREADAASANRYPSYHAEYRSPSGDIWSITVNGGCIAACPLALSGRRVGMHAALSETEDVVMYSGSTNIFCDLPFDGIPGAYGILVDRIDSDTLDGFEL